MSMGLAIVIATGIVCLTAFIIIIAVKAMNYKE